jgi:pantothenate synthetase
VAVLAARLGQVRLIDNHVMGARIGPLVPGG